MIHLFAAAVAATNVFTGTMHFVAETSFNERATPTIILRGEEAGGEAIAIKLEDTGLKADLETGADATRRVTTLVRLSARFEPLEGYALTVTVAPDASGDGAEISVASDGNSFAFRREKFPRRYRVEPRGEGLFESFAASTNLAEIATGERAQYRRLIRVNQVGYAANAPKRAEVPASLPFTTFRVQKMTTNVVWVDVWEGEFSKSGRFYKYADFSHITEPGDYRIVCGEVPMHAGAIRDQVSGHSSCWFKIRDGVYDHLQRMLFEFYTWQRCGSKKGWAGECHQDRVPLVGTDRTLDMRGGYHQSDDLRCWADDTARAVWQLFCWAERADAPWCEGAVEEELRWGAEYFEKLVGERGYAWDCQFEPIGWGPRNYYATPAPMSAQFCVLHVLCRAARYFKERDAAFAAKCFAKAEAVMRELERNKFFDKPYQPPVKIPRGSQPAGFYEHAVRGMSDIDAAFVSAAIELHEASGKAEYRERIDRYGEKMLATFGKVVFNGCCGIGDFIRFAPFRAFAATGDKRYRELLRRQCDEYIRDAENLQKNISTLAPISKGVVLMEGWRLFNDRACLIAAQRGLDWDLGVNRHEQSFVNGVGRNTQPHEVFGQFFPSTPFIPGAVVHRMDGEYNLPNAGILLLLSQRLNR